MAADIDQVSHDGLLVELDNVEEVPSNLLAGHVAPGKLQVVISGATFWNQAALNMCR